MKILVTGAAGYIGSHTVIELLENTSLEVLAVDNYANSSPKSYDRIEQVTGKKVSFEKLDLSDSISTAAFFEKHNDISGVIHFAALKAVGESVEQPLRYYKNNIGSLFNVLEGCISQNIPQLIFSSSCSVYGNAASLPVTENTPLAKTESPYAETKAMGERIVADTVNKHSLKAISLRYFNPVGAHESGLIGENPINKPNNLVPVITQAASGWIPPMSVHGSDYETRDGSCIRDYIHVSDIASAHVKALQKLQENAIAEPHTVVNLGTGNGVSVLEVIHAFERVSGTTLDYTMGPRRQGDVVSIYANNALAKSLLEWHPEKSLDDMMRSAWKWQNLLNKERNK